MRSARWSFPCAARAARQPAAALLCPRVGRRRGRLRRGSRAARDFSCRNSVMPAAIPNAGAGKTQTPAAAAPTAPIKRKRRWLRWLLGVFLVLLLIAFFLPNIIALPFIRQPLVERTFTRLNSKATIKSLSLGWF